MSTIIDITYNISKFFDQGKHLRENSTGIIFEQPVQIISKGILQEILFLHDF